MDTFFEQIIAVKKTTKDWLKLFGIIALAVLIIYLAVIFLNSLAFIITVGVIFGAYKLITMLMVEYEYIVTNGTMDIDKIIAKSSRKRIISFELSDVQQLSRYNPKAKPVGNYKKTVIACDENDSNAYFMVVCRENEGANLIVFSPNDKMCKSIIKFLPKYIANSAFSDK